MARRSISRTSPARSDAEGTDHAGMDGTEDPARWRETGEKWEVRSEHQRQRRENPREAENSPLLSTPLQLPVHAGPRVTHGTGSRELQRPRFVYPLICLGLDAEEPVHRVETSPVLSPPNHVTPRPPCSCSNRDQPRRRDELFPFASGESFTHIHTDTFTRVQDASCSVSHGRVSRRCSDSRRRWAVGEPVKQMRNDSLPAIPFKSRTGQYITWKKNNQCCSAASKT
uniref:Uncharacterized protein n=1 Tax=Oryza nivara TaxID=4536 RepID=A0A0E0GLA3_ORYNI